MEQTREVIVVDYSTRVVLRNTSFKFRKSYKSGDLNKSDTVFERTSSSSDTVFEHTSSSSEIMNP